MKDLTVSQFVRNIILEHKKKDPKPSALMKWLRNWIWEWATKMSNKFEDFLADQLKDPKLNKEYYDLESQYALIESIILARKEKNLSQKELSELTGIPQADLSKIENGDANPS